MSTTTVPNIVDIVANDTASSVVDPADNNFVSTNNISGQNIISTLVYYVYDPTSKTYTDDVFDYSFDDKVSVIGTTAGTGYDVDVLIGGVDELLFTGSVDGDNLTPQGDGAGVRGALRVPGDRPFRRTHELCEVSPARGAAEKTGAYLLTMTGKFYARMLAHLNTFKSIAMVDIDAGVRRADQRRRNSRPLCRDRRRLHSHRRKSILYRRHDARQWIGERGAPRKSRNTPAFSTTLGTVGGKGELEIIGGGDFNVGVGAAVDVKRWLSKGTAPT